MTLDLQQRVDALSTMAAEGNPTCGSDLEWESDDCMSVPAFQEGIWNGIAFWFKVSNAIGLGKFLLVPRCLLSVLRRLELGAAAKPGVIPEATPPTAAEC